MASSAPPPPRVSASHAAAAHGELGPAAAPSLRLTRCSRASWHRPPPLPHHGLGPRHCHACSTLLARVGVVRGLGEGGKRWVCGHGGGRDRREGER
uniref:Uncharacterized protein n=1 Tax=Arundo donax TaxID=35708 RepID=A0A0A8ZGW8_ARUDO